VPESITPKTDLYPKISLANTALKVSIQTSFGQKLTSSEILNSFE
jgi:hypothetical protein